MTSFFTSFARPGTFGRPPTTPYAKPGPATHRQQPTSSPRPRRIGIGASNSPTRPVAPPAPTPVSPPVAPAADPNVLPPDATYEQQVGAYARNRDTTQAGLTAQRSQGLLDFGYNEGAGGALSFDPNNPFSRAALMKQSYDRSRAQSGISMANSGQLYAGSYQNSQDFLNQNQLQGEDSLQKSLIRFLAGNAQAQAKAGTDYELGAGQAYGDRVNRAASNPLYTPTADLPSAPAAMAPAAPAPPGLPRRPFSQFARPGTFGRPKR
jgi:hypothetical protein